MKIKPIVIIVGIVSLFSILCLRNDYKVDVLPSLSESDAQGLKVTSKVYSSEDSKRYFSRDLLSRGYQPIQVTIQNNTTSAYSLDEESVNLPQASPREVAWKVSKGAIPRSIGYKVASLFFWPFMLPSTIDGIKTMHSHSKLRKDLAAKAIKNEKIVPYSLVNRVLIVPQKDLQKTLTVNLYDEQTGKLETFEMPLEVQASSS